MSYIRLFIFFFCFRGFLFAACQTQHNVIEPNQNELKVIANILSKSQTPLGEILFSIHDHSLLIGDRKIGCCNHDGRVSELILADLELTGTLPEELFKLTELTVLDLSHNKLRGGLSESIKNLTKLEELDLSSNSFSGVFPAIDHLQNLKVLYIQKNNFAVFPESIGALKELKILDLTYNKFPGKIPESYENLSSLDCGTENVTEGNLIDERTADYFDSGMLASMKIGLSQGFFRFTEGFYTRTFPKGRWGFVWPNERFVLPNETHLEKGVPYWEKVPEGLLYISVGTERSLTGALLSKSKYLLVLDKNPQVILYMRAINEILKIARDGDDFYKMRMNPIYLKEKIKKAKALGFPLNYFLLENLLKHGLWKNLVDRSHNNWFWSEAKTSDGLRYWENPELFARLKSMAVEMRIQAELFDFNLFSVHLLEESLQNLKLRIGALDLSNAHQENYIGLRNTSMIKDALYDVCHEEALFILTWYGEEEKEYFAFNMRKAFNISMAYDDLFIEQFALLTSP